MRRKRLIVVVGATAAGKTAECVRLSRLTGAQVVSADSRQVYRELNIGVARPSLQELTAAPHHLVAHVSIHDAYNVARYEEEAMSVIRKLFAQSDDVILSGGSGLYVKAVCDGLDEVPTADNAIREELNEVFLSQGIEPLQRELALRDPEYYNIVDRRNHIRLIRALEVCRQTNKPFSSFLKGRKAERDFEIVRFGIHRERQELIERINRRVDFMIRQGLIEEAEPLLAHRHLQALNTVGYKELFDYFEGKTSLQEAVERIKIDTRRYAKRQMTWFSRDRDIRWLSADKPIKWEDVL